MLSLILLLLLLLPVPPPIPGVSVVVVVISVLQFFPHFLDVISPLIRTVCWLCFFVISAKASDIHAQTHQHYWNVHSHNSPTKVERFFSAFPASPS